MLCAILLYLFVPTVVGVPAHESSGSHEHDGSASAHTSNHMGTSDESDDEEQAELARAASEAARIARQAQAAAPLPQGLSQAALQAGIIALHNYGVPTADAERCLLATVQHCNKAAE